MIFVEVLKEAEAANGAGTKKAIQEALAKLDPLGRNLMRYAMDPYKVFGVRKYDPPTSFASKDPADISFLFEVLDDLAARAITGNEARETVTTTLSQFTAETASFIERVLDKDPRAGFSADTFNKIWPNDRIPTFEVMLADKCEEVEDFEKYVTFPCLADTKLDGTRTIAIVRKDRPVEYRARSGKPSSHLDGLFDEELQTLRDRLDYDFVMDGETFAGNFTETMNAKKSDNHEAKNNLKFMAFFVMPIEDWINQSTTITMRQARAMVEEYLKDCVKLKVPKGREVKDYQDMVAYCNEVIDQDYQEGLILKTWDDVYQWDRSYTWVKVKRFYDVDARIVGFYPGRKKSRLENTVGGVNCVAFLESGERVEFNVGSGFSDAMRDDMKNNPDTWLKATHVITYQEVSKAKGKELRSLRFCTYNYTRDDKLVEI